MAARMTIDLPDRTATELANLTEEEERSKIEIIRRAISLYAKLRKISGDRISINTPEGKIEIIIV